MKVNTIIKDETMELLYDLKCLPTNYIEWCRVRIAEDVFTIYGSCSVSAGKILQIIERYFPEASRVYIMHSMYLCAGVFSNVCNVNILN